MVSEQQDLVIPQLNSLPPQLFSSLTLNSSNYTQWSGFIKRILSTYNLEEQILLDPPNEGNPIYGEWRRKDNQVFVHLLLSLDEAHKKMVAYTPTSKALWDHLSAIYGQTNNIGRIFEIRRKIAELKKENKPLSQLFGEFGNLWSELEVLRPPTTDPATIMQRQTEDKVFSLLMTLGDSYTNMRQEVLRMQNIPSYLEILQIVQRTESSLNIEETTTKKMEAHGFKINEIEVCPNCKKKGHTKDKCWFLHPHLRPKTFRKKEYTQTLRAQTSTEEQQVSTTGICLNSILNTSEWIIDSGCDFHMVKDRNKIIKLRSMQTYKTIKVANGQNIKVNQIGEINLLGKTSDALYVPNFTSNLMSVSQIAMEQDCRVTFDSNEVLFQDNKTKNLIGKGYRRNSLYVLDQDYQVLRASQEDSQLWHARLGHPSNQALKYYFPAISLDKNICKPCILGKETRAKYPCSTTIYEKPFDLVHSDVWTSSILSKQGYKYVVTFIDHKTRYTWVYMLTNKSQVFEAFQTYNKYVSQQYNGKIKILRSDNGGEYTSNKIKEYLREQGIIHQTSCPYTPQQNGVAERKNRHLLETARTLLNHANVPKEFWCEAVGTATHLINLMPTEILEGKSPIELIYNKKPNISHLKIFGCICYVLIPSQYRTKLDDRGRKCVFLGYSTLEKGYKCFDPITDKLYTSKDVIFVENEFFFSGTQKEEVQEKNPIESYPLFPEEREDSYPTNNIDPERAQEDTNSEAEENVESQEQGGNIELQPNNNEGTTGIGPNHNEGTGIEPSHNEGTTEIEPQPLRRSTRVRYPASEWINRRTYYHSGMICYPISDYYTTDNVSQFHQVFLSNIDKAQEPRNYEEAKNQQLWQEAMKEEIKALEKNGTWEITNLPKGKKSVGCKWVYKIKHKSDGEIERYKARLVAKGYTQTYGIDYKETFAPVAKMNTIRVLLTLAVNMNWPLYQMDVANAFLQGELEEEVYMDIPEGIQRRYEGKVCKLNKAIYGLKQSPRAWYAKLSSALLSYNFKKCSSDFSLFVKKENGKTIIILIYVDDIIITGSNEDLIQQVKSFLKSKFEIKDLGKLKYFLGIELAYSSDGLVLSQRKYTLELLQETGKLGAKPAVSPYITSKTENEDGKPWEDIPRFQRLVGKLIYLTITRPDLSFAVSQISQNMHAPKENHWKAAERILHYLKGTPGKGIWMKPNQNTEIVGYCDSDWAGDHQDRRSTTGYCMFVGGNLVSWKSKKQTVVSRSSAEAEYRAMAAATSELIWLKALVEELGFPVTSPIKLHCDNQSAIHIANNPVFHERTKHIEVDCHFIREKIEEKIITTHHINGQEQPADIFTKVTTAQHMKNILDKLGAIDLYAPNLRGSVKDQGTN